MQGLFIAVRALHFGATIVVFGEIFFAWLCLGTRRAGREPLFADDASDSAGRRFRRVIAGAWACMMISGACWLALASMQMSGQSLAESLSPSTLATVLGSTVYGQAWSVRALLALALLIMWPTLRADRLLRRRWAACLAISGGLLAGLAFAGHANAEVGIDSWVHHAGDAAHLLAAGAWLGGLAPLAALLERLGRSPTTGAIDAGAEIAARFGNWAALSVGVLLLTGTLNAYYLLASPQALTDTPYGQLLLVKLLLFAVMLAIAAVNRTRWTAALRADRGDAATRAAAARRLRRNVLLEGSLAAGVIVLVATLGVTAPVMTM
jgi:putative copper resistance protein D